MKTYKAYAIIATDEGYDFPIVGIEPKIPKDLYEKAFEDIMFCAIFRNKKDAKAMKKLGHRSSKEVKIVECEITIK